jgi:uncharacterized protein (TIGR03435 family)
MAKNCIRIALTIVCILGRQTHAHAQSTSAPAFAVATIKPGQDLPGKGQRPYAGGYEAKRVTVEDLISYAYNLPWGTAGLVSGGPGWAYTDTFDIEAKSEGAVEGKPVNNLTSEQISNLDRLMLQSLLASRFKLRVHHEVKQIPGFALTVARGGTKLTHSKPSASSSADGTQSGAPQPPRLTRGDSNQGRYRGATRHHGVARRIPSIPTRSRGLHHH